MGEPSKGLNPNHPSMKPIQPQNTISQASRTFAETTTQSKATQETSEELLSEEQGIIISTIQGIKMKEYVYAVGERIGKSHVKGAMRIPGNRIVLYVSTPALVDMLCSIDTKLFIGENRLILVPEKSRTRKIILSNVGLRIPNQSIVNALKNLTIEPASDISRQNLTLDEGYAVMSSRRQVYVKEEDILKIPETLMIIHDKLQYGITITIDSLGCYTCHSAGHLAKNCPQGLRNQQLQQGTPLGRFKQRNSLANRPSSLQIHVPNSAELDKDATDQRDDESGSISDAGHQESMEITLNSASKRPNSTTPGVTPSQEGDKESVFEHPKTSRNKGKKKSKGVKPRVLTPDFMRTYSTRLEEEIQQNPGNYCFNYDQFIAFMDETFDFKDVRQQTKQRQLHPHTVSSTLTLILPFVDDTAFKSRLTRMINKLDSITANPEEDGYLTASSTSSQK